ncbi:MAG: hypothetical protein BWY32_02076 [bacterium ADurb.Bin243]|nr:MAG: hypothetical protein BWY32_02076 [bacterium ADurb.Bin243]
MKLDEPHFIRRVGNGPQGVGFIIKFYAPSRNNRRAEIFAEIDFTGLRFEAVRVIKFLYSSAREGFYELKPHAQKLRLVKSKISSVGALEFDLEIRP